MDNNPFETQSLDDWENEAKEAQTTAMLKIQKDRELIHLVFEQSDAGQELLAKWTKDLVMTPSVHANSTQFEAGLAEGGKQLIRNIIIAIQSVEREQ